MIRNATFRTALLTTLCASVLILLSAHSVHAQLTGSVSGDSLCGADKDHKCTAANLKTVGQRLLTIFAYIGSAAVIVLILVRVLRSVWAYFNGDTLALKKASADAFNALIGFILIFAVGGGILLVMLKTLGVQPWAIKLLQFFSESVVPHAYAATSTEKLLPNPLGSNSAYDILIAAIKLAMQFFIYPGLIAMWVASGFKFIYSQGNPEGLKTARSWLLVSVIVTIVAFSLQGFVIALKNTAQKIVPVQASMGTSGTGGGTSASSIKSAQQAQAQTAATQIQNQAKQATKTEAQTKKTQAQTAATQQARTAGKDPSTMHDYATCLAAGAEESTCRQAYSPDIVDYATCMANLNNQSECESAWEARPVTDYTSCLAAGVDTATCKEGYSPDIVDYATCVANIHDESECHDTWDELDENGDGTDNSDDQDQIDAGDDGSDDNSLDAGDGTDDTNQTDIGESDYFGSDASDDGSDDTDN
jgi:hypothetical protein